MSRWSVAAVAIAGCCKPPAAAAPEPTPEPVTVEAPAPRFYEGLFEEGARWTFRVTREYERFVEDPDEDAPDEAPEAEAEAPEAEERATCWVETVRAYPGGRVSDIMCDTPEPRDAEHLVGVWVVDARGLWRGDYGDLEVGAVPDTSGQPYIARPPVAWLEETPDEPDPNVWEDRRTIVEVTHEGGDVWCRRDDYAATFAERFTLCLDEHGPLWWSTGWDTVEDSEDSKFERID